MVKLRTDTKASVGSYEYNKKYTNKYRKQIYFCECGGEIAMHVKNKHLLTNKHLKLMQLSSTTIEFNRLNLISNNIFAKRISI